MKQSACYDQRSLVSIGLFRGIQNNYPLHNDAGHLEAFYSCGMLCTLFVLKAKESYAKRV